MLQYLQYALYWSRDLNIAKAEILGPVKVNTMASNRNYKLIKITILF
jgi:hypothetical protein